MLLSVKVLGTLRSPARRACVILAALGAAACGAAQAQSAATVVVTAARQAQRLVDAVAHTTLISREEIERSQAVDLAALLAQESGLEFARSGARGAPTSLFMRGAPARQVLVLVDGVPLARQDATGQVGIEHMMLDQIDRIEVVRGNLSALYGAGAVGGVIQVFTRTSDDAHTRADLQAQGGSRGFAQAAARVAGALDAAGATRWSIGLAAERDRGASAINPADRPAANPDRDGYRNTNASLNLSHALAEGHRLGLGLTQTSGRLDYDSAFADPADLQRSRTRISTAQLSSDNRLGEGWSSRLVLSGQSDRQRYDETGAFGYQARVATAVRGLAWLNALTLTPTLKATAGVDLQRQSVDAEDNFGGVYDRARSVRALHGALDARHGEHEVQLQLRHDHVGGVGSRASGCLGWAWQLDSEWRVSASVANAFSAPPLGYLYDPNFGNPALRPEKAGSIELGAQWAEGPHRLRATPFASRVRDELDFDPAANRFDNIDRTRNQGLELSYTGQVGATDQRASLTAQDPQDRATGERRVRRAALLASAGLSHDLGGGLRAGLVWRHVGQRPDAGQMLPSYDLADLTLQWDATAAWRVFARIENLGDVSYQTAFGYDQPRRGAYIGLRWRGDL